MPSVGWRYDVTSEERKRLRRELIARLAEVSDDIARFGPSFVINKHEEAHLWRFSTEERNAIKERLSALDDADRCESDLADLKETA
jgi:hypothetical protein